MARRPKPGAPKGSPAWRERVRRGVLFANELARHRSTVLPVHLRQLAAGDVPEVLRPLVADAAAEHFELLDAVGGESASPQRRALVADAVSLGLLGHALLIVATSSIDREAAATAGSLLGQRARILGMIGLDRAVPDIDLRRYLESKVATPENRAGATIDGEVVQRPEATPERDTGANGGSAPATCDAEPALKSLADA
jgi:hypothetical protein